MNIIKEKIIGEYLISTEKAKLQVNMIHAYLCFESYWAQNIPMDILQTAIDNSLCLGIYYKENQIGFGRIVTDYATYGYLADVFILETHRKKGLSKHLMQFILDFDFINHLRRLSLGTKDAHSLYAQFGFEPLKSPERFMEIHQPHVYNNLLNH